MIDGRWRGRTGFLLSASLAYLDFEWTSFLWPVLLRPRTARAVPNIGNCDYAGFSNQLAPELTGVVSADYSWPIGSMMLSTTADLVYSGEYLQSLTLDPAATQDAYFKLNARVALTAADRRWELAVVGRNLTDKTTVSYAGDTPLSNRLFQARSYYGFPIRARIFAEGTIGSDWRSVRAG